MGVLSVLIFIGASRTDVASAQQPAPTPSPLPSANPVVGNGFKLYADAKVTSPAPDAWLQATDGQYVHNLTRSSQHSLCVDGGKANANLRVNINWGASLTEALGSGGDLYGRGANYGTASVLASKGTSGLFLYATLNPQGTFTQNFVLSSTGNAGGGNGWADYQVAASTGVSVSEAGAEIGGGQSIYYRVRPMPYSAVPPPPK